MGKKILYLAETYHLLPETQIGARRGKFTEMTSELLLEQIHTVWGQGNDKVATLLSMKVAGVLDTVSHQQLIHNLRRRKIPKWVTNWVNSFLKDQSTTLAIFQTMTEQFTVRTGFPQGSPLSPILYLFYNVNLLEICNQPGTNVSALGFVDDVNILAYGKSIEDNCRTLLRLTSKCIRPPNAPLLLPVILNEPKNSSIFNFQLSIFYSNFHTLHCYFMTCCIAV